MGFISLEPAPLLYQAPDEVEPTLFSRPARLQDVNETNEVFTRFVYFQTLSLCGGIH